MPFTVAAMSGVVSSTASSSAGANLATRALATAGPPSAAAKAGLPVNRAGSATEAGSGATTRPAGDSRTASYRGEAFHVPLTSSRSPGKSGGATPATQTPLPPAAGLPISAMV